MTELLLLVDAREVFGTPTVRDLGPTFGEHAVALAHRSAVLRERSVVEERVARATDRAEGDFGHGGGNAGVWPFPKADSTA